MKNLTIISIAVLLVGLSGTARARIVVDDFDSYADGDALWAVWDDYWVNSTDAEIYLETDPCGLNLSRSGNSVKFKYWNFTWDYYYGGFVGSWMDAQDMNELEVGSDWTAGGVTTLNVYFRGDPNSEMFVGDINAARMWVELEDTSSNVGTVYYGDVNDMFEAAWHKWNIDLGIYDMCGVTLSAIDRVTIGIGGAKAGQQAKMTGKGQIWLDDIRLTGPTDDRYIYVDENATGANDGTSWADAYKYLQDALSEASSNPDVNEIRVAEGIYRPDTSTAEPGGSGDRGASFELSGELTLKGGYAGYGEANPDLRRHDVFKTVLSGDLDGNDIDSSDPCALLYDASRVENSFHVVRAAAADNVVLDGFTITAGNANGAGADANGGGMYNESGGPTVSNCRWWRCSASSDGGAVWSGWSDPLSISHSSGMANTASRGGWLCNFAGTSMVTNCVLSGNNAGSGGGAVTLGGTVNVTNCTFSGNSAENMGGGICDLDAGTVTIKNSIFWSDTAPYGNEIAVGNSSTLDVDYSIVQDGNAGIYNDGLNFVNWGGGNSQEDPCFVDSGGPAYDFHLRSQGGTYRNEDAGWQHYEQTSPGIDMGEPGSPLGQETFANGGRINAGAYGGTSEASRSANPTGVCETWIAGDINGDCVINFLDLAFIGDNWLEDNTY